MPVSPLLIEGVWMTGLGQTLIFQQGPSKTKSSSDSQLRKHNREQDQKEQIVIRWPTGLMVKKRGKRAGTGRKQRIKAARESGENTENS